MLKPNFNAGFTLGGVATVNTGMRLKIQPAVMASLYQKESANVVIDYASLDLSCYLFYPIGEKKWRPIIAAGPSVRSALNIRNPQWAADVCFGLEGKLEKCLITPRIRYAHGESLRMFYVEFVFSQ